MRREQDDVAMTGAEDTQSVAGRHKLPAITEENLPAYRLVDRAMGGIFMILGLLLAVVLAVGLIVEIDVTIDGTGTLEPMRVWPVRSQEAGLITHVGVVSGDTIQRGDPIVQLDSLPLRVGLIQLQAQYEALQFQYRRATSAAPVELRRQEEVLAQANARLIGARATLRQRLVDYGLSEEVDSFLSAYDVGEHVGLDLAVADVMSSEAEMRSAAAQREMLTLTEMDLRQQRAELDRLELQIASAKERLNRLSIVAPISGMILTEHLEDLTGSFVGEGELLLEVAELGRWMATFTIREVDIHRIRIGNPVKVRIPALAALERDLVSGRVVSVASDPDGMEQGSDRSAEGYRVVAELDAAQLEMIGLEKLRRGYSVDGKVISRSGRILSLLWDFVSNKLDKGT